MSSEDLRLPDDARELLTHIDSAVRVSHKMRRPFLAYDPTPEPTQWHRWAAFNSLVAAANSALASINVKCPFASPPADINTKFDTATGNLRLECMHSPQHCWTLNGTRTRC